MTQTVKVEDGPQLTTKSKTVNAVKEKGVWMVNTDSVLVSVLVKNIGTVDGIQFVGNDAVNGNVVIYGMNGSKVAEVKGRDVRQYLTTLPKGLYIIRSRQRSWTVRN